MVKYKYYFLYLGICAGLFFITNYSYSFENQDTNKSLKLTANDSLKAINNLKIEIDAALTSKVIKKAKLGIAVYSVTNKKYYYSKNISQTLTPASNTKLFTTFNALNTMGPDYKIETAVLTDGTINDTVLDGNIYIVGKGDALMTITDIEYLADAIYERGIRKINGNIIGDGSFYDSLTQRVYYSGDKEIVEPIQNITALCLNKNTATVLMNSGAIPGKPVSARVIPPSDAFIIQNNAVVAGLSKPIKKQNVKSIKSTKKIIYKNQKIQSKNSKKIPKKRKKYSINDTYIDQKFGDMPPAASKSASRRKPRILISSNSDNTGFQKFIINGSLPCGVSYSYKYFIQNPNLVVAGTLKDRLESGGVKVSGKIFTGSIKSQHNKIDKIAEVNRPLMDLVYLTNKNSDNYLAETIFKMTGAYSGNHTNNSKATKEKLSEAIKKYNIPCTDCILNDGSGLSRRNVATTEGILNLLIQSKHLNFGSELDSSLAIAGIDGTLVNRMKGTLAENNLRAKTGTLGNVSALSGFVNTQDNELLAFSFVFNGGSVSYYKQIENKLGELLAKFKYSSIYEIEKKIDVKKGAKAK